MDLDNRELAGLIVLCIIAVLILMSGGVRSGLRAVARSFAEPKVATPFLGLFAWSALLVVTASRLGLWERGLLVETALWVLGPGIALLFGIATRKRDEAFFRPVATRAFKATAYVEVVVGLFVFGLVAELVLAAIVGFLVLLSEAAATRKELRRTKQVLDTLLAVIGLGLMAYVVVHVVSEWHALDKSLLARSLALPAYLTLGMVPFLYLIALWAGYDSALARIKVATDDPKVRRRAMLGLLSAIHFRAGKARAFSLFRAREIAEASSVAEARGVGRAFLEDERRRQLEAQEAKDRLERYAGVDGVDDDGRPLDQREFDATRKALHWLATAQMGWHRNQGGRYRTDLLDMLAPFVGLPEEHGIELFVAPGGQSWWAWRRTVTGWCFAIGAAEGPPDEWQYDGAEPPAGFPGKDPAWGQPFGLDAKNW